MKALMGVSKKRLAQKLAGPKIDGLFNYIKQENKKGKKFFGRIVANTDPQNYKGRWIYFDKSSEELRDNDFSNWENLEI